MVIWLKRRLVHPPRVSRHLRETQWPLRRCSRPRFVGHLRRGRRRSRAESSAASPALPRPRRVVFCCRRLRVASLRSRTRSSQASSSTQARPSPRPPSGCRCTTTRRRRNSPAWLSRSAILPHASATRLGHTPWPHLPSSLSHTPTPAGRLPQLLRLRARQEPGRLRTRHQGEWRRRPVNQPARPPAPKSRGTPAGPGAKPRRLRSCHAAHAAYERPGDEHVCSCLPWYGAREASAPAALQRHLGQRHPLASRRRARGPLHLRLGPIQPREWKGGCTRSLRARMPREHGSLVRHTPELQPQASKQGPRQLCHSHA